MRRSIKTLRNQAVFDQAVEEVAIATHRLLESLETIAL